MYVDFTDGWTDVCILFKDGVPVPKNYKTYVYRVRPISGVKTSPSRSGPELGPSVQMFNPFSFHGYHSSIHQPASVL